MKNNTPQWIESRRRLLKLMGGGVALASIAGLTACGGEEQSAPASSPEAGAEPETARATQQPAESGPGSAEETAAGQAASDSASEGSGDMPQLPEDHPQAKALGYRHDAEQVDASKYPGYQAGQLCVNCSLYQGAPGDTWGGCSIFPNHLVNANGWCSAYVRKA